MNEKTVERIGWLASLMAVAMYASYIDQIRLNLAGQPGSLVLPVMTSINCIAWIFYATLKAKTDWPILFCNALGLIIAIITAITTLL